ncbi:hypothetical protein [Rhizosaccharibacter radicis]|uniref:Entericidin n=1 Tax=Rhizosaccharibacter radicis TaxID=2782605 RepID=A0ABT1W489_9PROT|nr:hypothetical protein [Acetobacteraceae bacterium KSS12]
MTKPINLLLLAGALFSLGACENAFTVTGNHHQEDASTGSHLSGSDTGMDASQGMSDPSLRNVAGAAPGAGR